MDGSNRAVAEDKSSSWTEASPREESGHADPSVAPAASQHVSVSKGMISAVGDVSPVVTVAPVASAPMGPVRFSPSVSVRLAVAEDKSSSWTEASPRESGHADPSVAPADC